jgi:glycosyltransferase involved in cell wall biosynthesis
MTSYNLTIVTPKYPPEAGGAATYYELLVSELTERPPVETVTVVTQTHPSRSLVERTNDVTVYSVLPRTVDGNQFFRVITFVLTQIVLISLLSASCVTRDGHVVQIHSTISYVGRICYNHVLDRVLQGLRYLSGTRFILDVRDQHTIPPTVHGFDVIVCASENIYTALETRESVPKERLISLPVPIDLEAIREHDVDPELAARLPAEYVCFVGDISAAKGTPYLIEASAGLAEPRSVVLVGDPIDDAGRELLDSLPEHVLYLGTVSHDHALQIIEEASVLVLPSESEGLPRVVLEAIALETTVIVSPPIPELADTDDVLCLESQTVRVIRSALTNERSSPFSGSRYPIEQHDGGRVCDDLVAVHQSLLDTDSRHEDSI